MALNIDTKIEGQTICVSKNDMRNLRKFSVDHLKVSKLGLLLRPFTQSRKGMSLKFTGELCIITMNNVVKFEKKSTWGIWQILTQALGNLKHLDFIELPLTKVYSVWAWKVKSIYFTWHSILIQRLKDKRFVLPKMTWGT